MTIDKVNVEELKRRKDGLDVIHDILRYGTSGYESIDPLDFPLFRWWGLYQQRPNEGHFMLRLKVPNGQLTAEKLQTIGKISQDFGRNLIDITTRQTFQYHWLRIDNIPTIFERLDKVGMTTSGACGDISRNIVGCPVAGIDANEILNGQPVLDRCSALLTKNKEFSNLPRKFKVSLSGCHIHCAQPDINCIGFYGARMGDEVGFGLKVGGGLSTNPYFGHDMNVFLSEEEVPTVLIALTEMFRDADVLRQNRGRARFKFLLSDPKIGIGPVEFKRQLQEKLGRELRPGGPFESSRDAETDHLGIQKQKQEGLCYVGVGVRAGRLSGDKVLRIADITAEFSTKQSVRNTAKQNFIITDVPEDRLEELKTQLDAAELDYKPSVFKRSLISCTGIEFCNLAVTETKEVGRRVSRELEERFPEAARNVRIHFSGCPNNCGQNAIADIGLRGGRTKNAEGVMVEAFDILVGGTTGEQRAFAELCTRKFPSDQIATAIGNLYQAFDEWAANDDEYFQDFVRAHTKEQLDAIARGLPVPEAAPAPQN